MKKSALAIYKDLPNSLKIKDLKLSNLTLEQGFESLCQGFGIFNLIEVEVEIEIEVEVEETGLIPFEDFYQHYPRKASKENARKAWKKMSDEDRKEAIRVVQIYSWPNDSAFIPHPATWLNARRWEDELDKTPSRDGTGWTLTDAEKKHHNMEDIPPYDGDITQEELNIEHPEF